MNDKHPTRKQIRLRGYDYSRCGLYYITFCTYLKRCTLGKIEGVTFHPSPIGDILDEEIQNTRVIRSGDVELDDYTIMPNHAHIIFNILDATDARGTLGDIVGGIKSAATRRARERGIVSNRTKLWQGRYHDHIVRDEKDLWRIREYIRNNRATWAEDREYRSR